MDILEFLKALSQENPLELLLGMIHPVYGPMILWTAFILIAEDLQKFFGKR